MQEFEKLGSFYLGKSKDGLLLYDSRDLVTHAVCVGMTGSGKTGLCLSVLEEAAIDGVPALVIDPKGDLTNLLLTFPELRPEDFRPWINEEDAERNGLTADEFAAEQAALWRDGLARWGEDGARIGRLRDAAEFCVYTPGSDAGIPLSVLRSFAAPDENVRQQREAFRDRVNGTVTALLGLIGLEADPLKSREHILLATLLNNAWQKGEDLDLAGLIHLIQAPPVPRIGVMDVESFYPAKERFELAMALNNLLASPGFEAWMEGEALDIGALLRTASGQPKISILSISHLSDAERMFFVSLVLNEAVSWMRQQSGTTSLRALIYMDEIFGYFPPVANPPSKQPLLTLLKQARAFGVGVMLATQNPADLDYKGLANCGTWFIGRLQTERDKARVLDGLEGAATAAGGQMERAELDTLLSGLGNRVFLMNNVHDAGPVVFETRWALSYLRGPLDRRQIQSLMAARPTPAAPTASAARENAAPVASAAGLREGGQRPVLAPEIRQYFLPAKPDVRGLLYQPMLVGFAQVRFVDAKSRLDRMDDYRFLVPVTDDAVPAHWDEAISVGLAPDALETAGLDDATFAGVPPAMTKTRSYTGWSRDFAGWIAATQAVQLWRSPSTGEVSRPGESERNFRARVQLAAREARDTAVEKLRQKYAAKLATVEDRIRRAHAMLEKEQAEAQARTVESALDIGGTLLGAFLGRRVTRRATSSLSSINRARKDAMDVDRAQDQLQALEQQRWDLELEMQNEAAAAAGRMDALAEELSTVLVRPKKANVSVQLLALGWVPYVRTEDGSLTGAW